MKEKLLRLKALLIAGAMAASPVIVSGCDAKEKNASIVAEMSTARFGIGEHIISIPLVENIGKKIVQHEHYPGYEPIGISISAYGHYSSHYGGGAILYANTEEVECTSTTAYPNGCYIYNEFGTPLNQEQKLSTVSGNTREFGIGEHIISVPINVDNIEENIQYEYHEGYEIVGIGSTSYGKYSNYFGEAIVLYKNVVPVRCTNSNEGYTSFGVPVETVKTKKFN